MLWRPLLCSFFYICTVTTLSISRHGKQQPLPPAQQQTRYEAQACSVMLAVTPSGGIMEQLVEIPLDKRILSGAKLPSRPKSIEMIAAVTNKGRSVSLERLDSILCNITLDYSSDERKATGSDGAPKVLPGFALRDEVVQFEDASSSWFLGDRMIDSYECR
ncbi:cytochrome c oxidase subunit vib [Pyrenophora seminiperda CCB06]|uniref:Cytochrome c oxidase subunit vib n=1 Tax=Pyrenophora seminiperda CCB06 TaxID=1302712 RepID=A0A3M7M725_9PLEO|nr:cytochrome c oxidase subunit vib [Pyrenophora seminiperda CCB06]